MITPNKLDRLYYKETKENYVTETITTCQENCLVPSTSQKIESLPEKIMSPVF